MSVKPSNWRAAKTESNEGRYFRNSTVYYKLIAILSRQ